MLVDHTALAIEVTFGLAQGLLADKKGDKTQSESGVQSGKMLAVETRATLVIYEMGAKSSRGTTKVIGWLAQLAR